MNVATKLIQYLRESRIELKKVIWPNRQATTNHTTLVIGFSLGMALFLAAVDYFFTYLFNQVVK